jgi:hypothetical protein
MTSEDVRSELEVKPFGRVRLHLVSGAVIEVTDPGTAWVLQNAVMITARIPALSGEVGGYSMVALRNIERIERIPAGLEDR